MDIPSRRNLFIFACVVVIGLTYFFSTSRIGGNTNVQFVESRGESGNNFLVFTQGCKIPNIDPFDPSINKLIEKGKPLYCGDIHGLTYQINNTVYVNKTVASAVYKDKFTHCDSDTVLRVVTNSDNRYKFVPNGVMFRDTYDLGAEFTRIKCYNKSKSVIHYNFYARNILKPEAEKRYKEAFPKHVKTNSVKHAYNVVLMGIDSVARLNFMRHLQKTRKYLLNEMGAIDITGYNKVEDNTFVNLVPFLSGKYVPELPYITERDKNKPFDEYDFIFKRFRSAGYRTLFAEDDPMIATFNYIKEGFYKVPADDYLRPMSVAMEREKTIWFKDHCVHERGEHDIYTDYLYRFMKANTVANRPYFSFTFLTRITHYWMNKASLADDHHFKFLQRIHEGRLLDNTILLYFSDHGMRYGAIRDTYVGKMSARLPAMYVYLPTSFKLAYPKLYQNVLTNAHRLTTPFDIYETLRDVLYFNNSVGRRFDLSSRGISLFSEIPKTRTCQHAGLAPHWCACANHKLLSINDSLVIRSAEFLVKYINTLINKTTCASLSLDHVTSAYQIEPNSEMLVFEEKVNNIEEFKKKIATSVYYQITILASPGGGRFEGTVKQQLSSNKMTITSDISRTNLYKDSSWCADSTTKKFCYCKLQKSS